MPRPQKICKFRGKQIDRILLKLRHAVVIDIYGGTFEHYFGSGNWQLERHMYKQEFAQYIVEDVNA